MQLSTYIQDLLYRYECVIIPGFGAFLTHYASATIDTETHTFYPPGKSISFNRQLQTNDGLLANYVASVQGSSYEVALQKIRNFTGKLSLELSEGKTVSLENIGDFSLNNERTVQFIPTGNKNFDAGSFGLTTFISSEVSRAIETTISEAETTETPLLFTPRKRTTPYIKYAAVGLIAIAIAGLGGMKLYEKGVQDHNFVQKQKAETLVQKQIQEATFVISNPLPTINVAVPKQTGKYHIVAGAFRVEENATKKVGQLHEKGFTAKLIGENRYGLHQVVYASYENRLEALASLRNIKRTENKDAWLLVKELKN
ncbi:MAG: SPOR domain-containing protein [Patiriisocius sp.]|uniref:HU domain-containing protein n=1 Tax=Patiriisocius sp. TaxID=2822396 RepID=UPI003EFA702A